MFSAELYAQDLSVIFGAMRHMNIAFNYDYRGVPMPHYYGIYEIRQEHTGRWFGVSKSAHSLHRNTIMMKMDWQWDGGPSHDGIKFGQVKNNEQFNVRIWRNAMTDLSQQQFDVTTFSGLLAVRSLTGITRIGEHFLLNGDSCVLTSESWMLSGFEPTELTSMIDQLEAEGWLVEMREQTSMKQGLAFSFNAFLLDQAKVRIMFNLTWDTPNLSVTTYRIRKESDVVGMIEAHVSSRIIEKPIKLNYVCGFSPEGKMMTDVREVSKDQATPVKESYPWIPEGIDVLQQQFMGSNNNLLFLIGEPGTGKSTLIRELCRYYKDRPLYQFAGEKVIADPAFDAAIAKLPKNAVCIIEDADNLVGKRTDGNTTMAMFLNEIDGVASKGIKFIVSTNLPNKKSVDAALLRPGRCYKTLEFKRFTYDESVALYQALNMDITKIPTGRASNLAELMSEGGDASVLTAGPGFRNDR